MANDLMVSLLGLSELERQMQQMQAAGKGEKFNALLSLAAGMVHRYLMGLSRERPPLGAKGVLPVISGRLKNSFFFGTTRQGNTLFGFVRTNLVYAADVEARRGFLAKTTKDMEKPVNDLFAAYIGGSIR